MKFSSSKTLPLQSLAVCLLAGCFAAASLCMPLRSSAQTVAATAAFDPGLWDGKAFKAEDSLDVGDEPNSDAGECLAGLCWDPVDFEVNCRLPGPGEQGDLIISFPSPLPSGDDVNDRVAMECYLARDGQGQVRTARAVVVVHESGSGMKIGRLIAKGIRGQGMHAMMIQLPYYGLRSDRSSRPRDARLIPAMRQAIADVRRARDAVAALPMIDCSHIALQGTSLGGLVCATTAGLDRGYDSVHLMLAGGHLYELLQNGKKDAQRVREQLAQAGISGEQLKSLARQIEPVRLAHRVDPQATWLFSGMFDTVVPPANSLALAKAAGLDARHHVQLPANHYSGIIFLPLVLDHIREVVSR